MLRHSFKCHALADVKQQLSKKLRMRYLLAQCPCAVVSARDFEALCTSASSIPEADRMTPSEASSFLDALHRARIVLWDGDRVFLRPQAVVNRVHTALSIPELNTQTSTERDCEEKLTKDAQSANARGAVAVERAAVWRQRFWSGVAVGSGTQMTVLAYLTFVVYGWDVMEPASYFVTCMTSIAFYAYFLLYRREQSLTQVDENFLPSKLDRYCGDQNVDPAKWMQCLEELKKGAEDARSESWNEESARTWLSREIGR